MGFNSEPAHLWGMPLRVQERLQRLCSHMVSGMPGEELLEVVEPHWIKDWRREWSVDSQCRQVFRKSHRKTLRQQILVVGVGRTGHYRPWAREGLL